MTTGKTTNCVICFADNPGIMGGHVHKGMNRIFATICRNCKNHTTPIDSCKGCYGEWSIEMGYEPYQISVGYIDVPIK